MGVTCVFATLDGGKRHQPVMTSQTRQGKHLRRRGDSSAALGAVNALLTKVVSAAALPSNSTSAGVLEADGSAATSTRNARAAVARVRQVLRTEDPWGGAASRAMLIPRHSVALFVSRSLFSMPSDGVSRCLLRFTIKRASGSGSLKQR